MLDRTIQPHRIPAATVLAAVASAVGNAAVWAVGEAFSHMNIGLGEVLVASVIGSLLGGVAFALCGRFARRPIRMFVALSVAVVVLYAGGPVTAHLAPYREGAELFNVATLVATEVMHLVSAIVTMALLIRRASTQS